MKKELWIPDAEWFWAKVQKGGVDECWEWKGARWRFHDRGPRSGYGQVKPTTVALREARTILSAHRVAWAFANGPVPEGVMVLHRCNNPPCCNPGHLFLGDDQANSDDKYEKGRGQHARGEVQHLAKLTEERVRIIRRERASDPPTPIAELAKRFGVTTPAVSFAASGHTWKHVDEPFVPSSAEAQGRAPRVSKAKHR